LRSRTSLVSDPFYREAGVILYCGDAATVLAGLPSESVDCVVCSPPYWSLRDYQVEGQIGLEGSPDEYVERLVSVFREARRVLAPHGVVFVNIGDSYAANRSYQVVDNKHKFVGNDRGMRVPEGVKPKDLLGVPWRFALAMQDDGWWLRSEIIWAKGVSFLDCWSGSVMPESVRDRPTRSHEQVFMFTKNARYHYDIDAVREPNRGERWGGSVIRQPDTSKYADGEGDGAAGALSRPGREWDAFPEGGRNLRTVWAISSGSSPEVHFATMPQKLVTPMVQAGCPEKVCSTCGKPSERIMPADNEEGQQPQKWREFYGDEPPACEREPVVFTDCGHDNWRTGVVLDPFAGSGTTLYVARLHGRHSIGVELNPEYCGIIERRLSQQSLFAEAE